MHNIKPIETNKNAIGECTGNSKLSRRQIFSWRYLK